MNDYKKEEWNEILDNVVDMKRDNSLCYWLTLAMIGAVVTSMIIALLKLTGIILLVTGAFMFITNNCLMAWKEIRENEKKAKEAEKKADERKVKRSTSKPIS